MEVFEFILIMLGAVFISNVINRFFPIIAVPLIQVILGVLLAIPLGGHHIQLDPELFLLLFMAPLLFNDGSNVDKKSLWRQRRSILSLSIGLVFLTVFVLGSYINVLIPSIPLAAAFALAAALAPTDAVAVSALSEKVNVPHKIMHNLEGESLINDASGLVSFQFAVLALQTGAFSLSNASITFLLLSFGGVALGAVMSLIKIIVMRWLRNLGIENMTSFMLMEILLPFLIFMTAEHIGVNGILAVVSGGIVHSFSYRKMNPEVAKLNILSKNTWSVIIYSLNGLVFVILGTQLPSIIRTIWKDSSIDKGRLLIYILGITFVLLMLRFIWILLFKNFEKEHLNLGKGLKNTFLYTISGVRGTITLVSALSLPFLLGNGEEFVERDLLIFIAAGVIIVTLILANFILPLLAPKKELESRDNTIEIEILRDVVKELKTYKTDENKIALGKVIRMYNNRILSSSRYKTIDKSELDIRILIFEWQLENVKKLLQKDEISIQTAIPLINRLNIKLYNLTKLKKYKINIFRTKLFKQKIREFLLKRLSFREKRDQIEYIQKKNNEFILKKLRELDRESYPPEILDLITLTYARRNNEIKFSILNKNQELEVQELMDLAAQIERDTIHSYFETGKITRKEMKTYRQNLLLIENNFHFSD